MVLTPTQQPDASLCKRSYSILIADDDQGNREALGQVLTQRGFQTLLAANGEEAVEIIQVEMIHLVLIDMHMPRLSGLEAIEIVRQRNQQLPTILMTADATREIMRKALQAQVFSVIPKPVNSNVVLHTPAVRLPCGIHRRQHAFLHGFKIPDLRGRPEDVVCPHQGQVQTWQAHR